MRFIGFLKIPFILCCFNNHIKPTDEKGKAMKKFTVTALAATLFATSGLVLANQPMTKTAQVSVKQALSFADDRHVQLSGQIVKNLGDEHYQFRDQTGTIVVEIDDDLWQGKPLNMQQTLTLMGEVDRDDDHPNRVEIDVDHIRF